MCVRHSMSSRIFLAFVYTSFSSLLVSLSCYRDSLYDKYRLYQQDFNRQSLFVNNALFEERANLDDR
jgi:hypothetical protein